MDIFEITGFATGISREGVNYLQPSDSFQNMLNGYIYRQVLYSRNGFKRFSLRRVSDNVATDNTRIMGIFEHFLPNNTTELLVCTKKYLYKYNTGTDVFDRIPMAGSIAASTFNITNNYDYVSGTTYPFADGTQRFVFTGRGMAQIYMYDGTDVKRFNLAADNPDYIQPASGALTNAWYVLWFGERLNLFNPTIAGSPNPQMMLYSGPRDIDGNGDNFNTVGSGALSADTPEYITGASIFGDKIIENYTRSNWTIEKTRDPFNPYFIRKIPSVLGTTAPFSAVAWGNLIESIGETAVIATDGRESLRIDDKIPFFTMDEIDQSQFDLIYGGFDRINGQFLFSYPSINAVDLDTQDAVLVNNYEEKAWAINTQRFSCFGQTDKGVNLTWDDIYEVNDPAWARWDTTEETWNTIGLTATTQKTLAGDDRGFVYQLNTDEDDYFVDITAISQATQAVLTVGDHAFMVGDLLTISGVLGMTEINNYDPETPTAEFIPYNVVAVDYTAGTVTINENSTNYTAYTTGGTLSKPIDFYAETIPFNPYRDQGRMCFVSHIEFLVNTNNGTFLVDIYDNEEESPFKSNVPVIPTSTTKEREWISVTVDQEANFLTFSIRQLSPALQVQLTSMRIHCQPGGLTSA